MFALRQSGHLRYFVRASYRPVHDLADARKLYGEVLLSGYPWVFTTLLF